MENQELKILVDELIGYGKELEWLEFKQGNATDNQRLGKYISGLANAANFNDVLYGYLVQLPVVYAHPKTPILLLHKQNRSTPRRCTWSNKAFV